MPMDRYSSSSRSSDDGSRGSSYSSTMVLAIECVAGSSKAEEWNGDMLQSGDIVEEIRIGDSSSLRAPFKNGKSGVQKMLHSSYKKSETSILVRASRGRDDYVDLLGSIVLAPGGRKQYMVRAINDTNYAVAFVDRIERDCFEMQGIYILIYLLSAAITGPFFCRFEERESGECTEQGTTPRWVRIVSMGEEDEGVSADIPI